MAEPLRIYPLTVDDVHAMAEAGILDEDARVELIDGQLVEKMTIGPIHLRLVNLLNEFAVGRASAVVEVSIQNPVRLNRYSETEPDVVLLRKDRDVSRIPESDDVLLLIEVADATVRLDQSVKLPRYAEAGIPEVWIVNIPERHIEQYSRPGASGYADRVIHTVDGVIESLLVPQLGSISVASLLDA